MKPLYIFDLDGTLALIQHRRHFVSGENHNWPAFYAACDQDEPNWPVLITMEALYRFGADLWIWSGRSDEVYGKTVAWLFEHTPMNVYELEQVLKMRTAGDYTPDDNLKRSWYEELTTNDKRRLVAVFDDRDRMVAMWRSLGVACYQVAPGDF
jgi:hypothetical protein